MVRVIFNTGKEIKYEYADSWLHHSLLGGEKFIKIMRGKDWIASAPADCIIDSNNGSSANAYDLDKAASYVIDNIKFVSKYNMRRLKRLAMKYQIRTNKWLR